MYVDHKRKIAFIMHPRTASSSLTTVFPDSFVSAGTRHSIESELIESDWEVCCVVRHPIDTLVSWFYVSRYNNFQEWLYSIDFENHMWLSKGMFFGLKYATRVLRFENLQPEWNLFCLLNSITAKPIPRLNPGTRRNGRPWWEVAAGCTIPEFALT